MVDLEARISLGESRQVHLVTSGVRVDLSDTIERIRIMITSLERSVREYASGKELLGSDVLMHFALTPSPDSTAAPDCHEG
jgi:hypothetical protein